MIANDEKLEEDLANLTENIQKIDLFHKYKSISKLFILLINNIREKKINLPQKTSVFDEKYWYWKGMKENKRLLYFYLNFKVTNLVDLRNHIILEAEKKIKEIPGLKTKKEVLTQEVPIDGNTIKTKKERTFIDSYSNFSSCRVF